MESFGISSQRLRIEYRRNMRESEYGWQNGNRIVINAKVGTREVQKTLFHEAWHFLVKLGLILYGAEKIEQAIEKMAQERGPRAPTAQRRRQKHLISLEHKKIRASPCVPLFSGFSQSDPRECRSSRHQGR